MLNASKSNTNNHRKHSLAQLTIYDRRSYTLNELNSSSTCRKTKLEGANFAAAIVCQFCLFLE